LPAGVAVTAVSLNIFATNASPNLALSAIY
jgi:hypothetical protein